MRNVRVWFVAVICILLTPVSAQEGPPVEETGSIKLAEVEGLKTEVAELKTLVKQLGSQITSLAAAQKQTTVSSDDLFAAAKRQMLSTRDLAVVRACFDRDVKGKPIVYNGQMIGCMLER